jgi:putative PIN family toxin of toxin-antitoxin system
VKVVVDTNVIVSAAMKNDTPPNLVLGACLDRRVTLVTTAWQLDELQRVLRYSRISARLLPERRSGWLASIRHLAQIVVPTGAARGAVPRDPDEENILEAAIAGEADYIVTGDKDLLDIGAFEGIAIVDPVRFVAILRERGMTYERIRKGSPT